MDDLAGEGVHLPEGRDEQRDERTDVDDEKRGDGRDEEHEQSEPLVPPERRGDPEAGPS